MPTYWCQEQDRRAEGLGPDPSTSSLKGDRLTDAQRGHYPYGRGTHATPEEGRHSPHDWVLVLRGVPALMTLQEGLVVSHGRPKEAGTSHIQRRPVGPYLFTPIVPGEEDGYWPWVLNRTDGNDPHSTFGEPVA